MCPSPILSRQHTGSTVTHRKPDRCSAYDDWCGRQRWSGLRLLRNTQYKYTQTQSAPNTSMHTTRRKEVCILMYCGQWGVDV